ncbi:ATP-binding protein [Zhengella mangrovi]|uniref:ATP-binding protein n=1 Tax=Zhengella mangrovi TaxID=1982044 RepID=A0A2G1QSC0_9HYPH|nr:terminase family protein [Zhengella mangrovi]PHP68360.1 ATP-binding protein [Zhengella mangrovi]
MPRRSSTGSSIDTWPPARLRAARAVDNPLAKAFACHDWPLVGRRAQRPPDGDWSVWLILAGRGFGKTRAGAEWVRAQVRAGARRIGLIAPTAADARDVMVSGESGILKVCWPGDCDRDGRPTGRPVYEVSRRRLVWKNGAVAMLFSAEEPERLRGPQHDALWCDELAAWRNLDATWDMASFGLRLGHHPRTLVTTTPKPLALLRRLVADPNTAVTRGSTRDNARHLAAGFIEAVQARYGGTRLGRQELDGEIIGDREGALWNRDAIEAACARRFGAPARIVVAVDPPAASTRGSDACGIVAAGADVDGHATVLADASVQGVRPHEWAAAAIRLFHALEADCLLAEVNQGGEMVASVIASVDPGVPVKAVRATRGKFSRAEPVSALYQQGKVAHAARFAALEDEMCDFTAAGLSSGRSPDRLDALVWALSELLLSGPGRVPRIRHV